MSKTAHIVAIKVASLGDLGFGISGHPGDIAHILAGETWVGPRPSLETDEDFVQPIPYIVVRKGTKVLLYVREAGDSRLKSKASIGFGGHVDLADCVVDHDGVIDLKRTMLGACQRELHEELGLFMNVAQINWSHVISCSETPVDRVHVGLVAMVELNASAKLEVEAGIGIRGFLTPEEIMAGVARGEYELEAWSQLALNSIMLG